MQKVENKTCGKFTQLTFRFVDHLFYQLLSVFSVIYAFHVILTTFKNFNRAMNLQFSTLPRRYHDRYFPENFYHDDRNDYDDEPERPAQVVRHQVSSKKLNHEILLIQFSTSFLTHAHSQSLSRGHKANQRQQPTIDSHKMCFVRQMK